MIGILGCALAPMLYLIGGLRPTPGLPRWQTLESISSYYYSGAVSIFVGVLFALSLFLFTYKGYKGVLVDRVLGIIGGSAAFLVAFFPTQAPQPLSEPSWWRLCSKYVHYGAAVVLFSTFVVFAGWLFRKSNVAERRLRDSGKQKRDAVSLGCAIVIGLSMIWATIVRNSSIFYPECVAVTAFGVSWVVKALGSTPKLDQAKHEQRGIADATNVNVQAFAGTQNVMLAINRNTSATITIASGGVTSVHRYTTSNSKKLSDAGVLPVTNGSFTVSLDAQSVSTFVVGG